MKHKAIIFVRLSRLSLIHIQMCIRDSGYGARSIGSDFPWVVAEGGFEDGGECVWAIQFSVILRTVSQRFPICPYFMYSFLSFTAACSFRTTSIHSLYCLIAVSFSLAKMFVFRNRMCVVSLQKFRQGVCCFLF